MANVIPPNYQFTVSLGNALNPTEEVIVTATVAQTVQLVNFINGSYAPSKHATTHISGGGDQISLPIYGATGMVPGLNSTSGSGQQTHVFLRGDATWSQLPRHAYT